MWCETPCDINFSLCQRSTRQCSQASTFSHGIVNKQMHEAVRVVGPTCCQDAAVAAVIDSMHTQYLGMYCTHALVSKLCKSFNQVRLSRKHSFGS